MPYFLKCTTPHVIYRRGEKVINNPINLDLCTSISKTRLAWYPDNVGLPEITFHGCDAKWAFNSDQDRDAEFDRIANLRSNAAVTRRHTTEIGDD